MSAAVVPVKHLAGVKSRLLSRLTREQLEALSLAMLRDVLGALCAAPSLDRVAVATPDPAVAAAAREAGAEALEGPDPGLNEAIDGAAHRLGLADDEPLLVVLGDVAGASADDIEALFAELGAVGGRGGALAPSADGGTSALLRSPHNAFPACFGPQSAAAHRAAAERAGVPFRSTLLPSLALDLDCAEDIDSFLVRSPRHGDGGANTRAILARFGWRTHR